MLKIDLTGGEDWQATSAMWHPWDEAEEGAWVHTRVTVSARGESLTIFQKGYLPLSHPGSRNAV